MSLYSNSNYLSSTVSIYYCGVELTSTPINYYVQCYSSSYCSGEMKLLSN